MAEETPKVARRAGRAILFDDQDRLVVIRRTKPGLAPYWTTPGGGVEPGDASVEAAMRRELIEELGAQTGAASQVFLASSVSDADAVSVQYFFVTRLTGLDPDARTGAEFDDPARGGYDLDRIEVGDIPRLDLKPAELKAFIVANAAALLAEVGS